MVEDEGKDSGRRWEMRKQEFSGIVIRSHGEEWLSRDIHEVAKIGKHLVGIYVCSDSEDGDSTKVSSGFPVMKKVNLRKQRLFRGTLAQRLIKRLAKHYTTMAVMLEMDSSSPLGNWISLARYYANRLGPTSFVLAVHQGNTIFKRQLVDQLGGSTCLKDVFISLTRDREASLEEMESNSAEASEDYQEYTLGWPLLRRANPVTHNVLGRSEARIMSVVQWAMSLPSRDGPFATQTLEEQQEEYNDKTSSTSVYFTGKELSETTPGWPLGLVGASASVDSFRESAASRKVSKNSKYRWYSYAELQNATSEFSKENFIGEGGCSTVYRGTLSSGRSVVVKVLKPYKKAWKDFLLEAKIVSLIKHKHITPLLGVCLENECPISVYDYFPNGSLEDNLHGEDGRRVLPWETRFEVAIAIAESLYYLHNTCSKPVIHRDVKSSNILLTKEFQPQLSDFGLAIWGPTDSSHVTDSDVVGTFGYIAPEYLMHGTISSKVDVYAYGVVLLELLSGRRPIESTAAGQESLIKWTMELQKNGDLKALLDPKLNGDFDVVQAHRMVSAANLCIKQSPRFRPNISQIIKLLRGEVDGNECANFHVTESEREPSDEAEGFDPDELSSTQGFSLAMLDSESDFMSFSSTDSIAATNIKSNRRMKLKDYLKEQNNHRMKLKDYLKKQQD